MIAFSLPNGTRYAFSRGPGDTAEDTVVELDAQAWDDLREERRSAFGLLYAGMLQFSAGRFEDLAAWEPELRRQWHGRPPYDGEAMSQVAQIDLRRSYTLDDTDEEMRDYLQATGFLHVRNVFAADEIAIMREEVERLKALAAPDDGGSWFAKNRDGEQVCCRLIYLAQRSDELAKVPQDGRLLRLAALSGERLRPTIDRLDGVSVVIKNPDVVEGLSDLPWHQDCGLGGHPVLCPSMNIGIQLDVASADNGQLRFLAGLASAHDPGRLLQPAGSPDRRDRHRARGRDGALRPRLARGAAAAGSRSRPAGAVRRIRDRSAVRRGARGLRLQRRPAEYSRSAGARGPALYQLSCVPECL